MSDLSQEPPASMPREEGLPPRLDLWTALVFFIAGVAILATCLGMPTYREQQGEIYKAPGMVPGLYGIVIIVLSLWLGSRALKAGALRPEGNPPRPPREGYSNLRLFAAAALCVTFAVGLVGRIPFWLAAALFVFAFSALFEWRRAMPMRERMIRLASSAAIGLGTGLAVVVVFERIFLVRLP